MGGGKKVWVKDRDNPAGCALHTLLQRSRLKAAGVGAVPVVDRNTGLLVLPKQRFGEWMRVIGGIVQHLDLQQMFWIIHLGGFFDQTFHYVALVVKRKLNGQPRKRFELHRRDRANFLLVLEVSP